MPSDNPVQATTPGWLVAVATGVLLLMLALIWLILPWPAALMATMAAYMGNEVGMVGARWVDDKERSR